MGQSKQRYADLKAIGLCTKCAKEPTNGKSRCEKCLKKHSAEQVKRKKVQVKDRKALGLCRDCGKSPVVGKVRCQSCADAMAMQLKRLYIKRKLENLCVDCGEAPPNKGKTKCEKCSERYREQDKIRTADRTQRLKKIGLCVGCGKVKVNGVVRCVECTTKQKDKVHKHNRKLKDKVFAAYGGYRCNCCGLETSHEFMQMDHVENNGKDHRKQLGYKNIYRWLVESKFPEGFQVLCAGCNFAKRNYGICPHRLPGHPEYGKKFCSK